MISPIWRPAAADRFTPGREVPITTIVYHTSTTSFENTIATFQSGSRMASAHYVVDRDIDQIAQCVRETDTAWHAGNWLINQKSCGIERADYGDWWNPGPDAQIERIVALSRQIIERNPTIDTLIRHDQATATACPDGLDTPRIFWEVRSVALTADDKKYIDNRIRDILLGEPALTITALKRSLNSLTQYQVAAPKKATKKSDVTRGHGRG